MFPALVQHPDGSIYSTKLVVYMVVICPLLQIPGTYNYDIYMIIYIHISLGSGSL